jgi:agmatinase
MPFVDDNFLGLDAEESDWQRSRVVVLPVPFERTTSYGKGTVAGPAAILAASRQVDLYDEELRSEPHHLGVHTLPTLVPEAIDLAEALAEIETEAHRQLAAGKFLITLGGEHSLTQAPVRALARVVGNAAEVGVVQFDAHADLRESYEGTPYSHACVMRRLVEAGHPTLGIGIRSLSKAEGDLIAERQLPTIWGYEIEAAEARFEALLPTLPEKIYLTIDVDYFDPALMPATGTPEPGGGTWWPTLRMLRRLFATKTVLAMDVVELAPLAGLHTCNLTTARLLYKCLGYLQAAEGR